MPQKEPQLLVTDDGSYTVYDPSIDETYHSRFGARSESDQVFLQNSLVAPRLAKAKPTSILEIGFGTGYNFVHTARQAIDAGCVLDYTAIEMHPLPSEMVKKVLEKNKTENALSQFTADALDQIGNRATENHGVFKERIKLYLVNADARLYDYPPDSYDAIYLDAFSKKNNPGLWESEFLINLKYALRRDGRLATYCVNRSFRDALADAGWSWQKLPGPRGKREVMIAMHTTAAQ